MKDYIYFIIGMLFVVLIGINIVQGNRIDSLETDLSYSKANEKALFEERDSLSNSNRTLYLSIDQLNAVNDSIIRKMNATRRELDIKDKEIKELQYQLSTASKTDTLFFRDTLFREPEFKLDTLFGDKWYNMKIHLEYPSIISVSPTFISERYVNMYLKKETINPPKKCFIARWFQKKHKVMTVEIVEENPYIQIIEQKYIKIIE